MKLWAALLLSVGAMAQTPPRLSVQSAVGGSQSAVAPGSLLTVIVFSAGFPHPVDPSLIQVTLQSQGSGQIYSAELVPNAPYYPFVWAIVPDAMPPGPATATLAITGSSSLSTSVMIAPVAPWLFSVGQNGYGPALAQNVLASAAPALNQLTNPALPGGLITLWGTGLGSASTADVAIDVAGTIVPATFAGRSPGLPGVDQINFQLPADSYTGCYVSVTLHAGTVTSNSVTLSIDPTPGACAHPLGLSHSELQTLDSGGYLPVGSLSLQPPRIEFLFTHADAELIFVFSQPQAPPRFGCEPPSLVGGAFLFGGGDAGRRLTLTGPGAGFELAESFGVYSPARRSDPTLLPGVWQISAPGGKDIGPFEQSFTLPPSPHLTSTAFSGSGDFTATWDPKGYSGDDVMTVQLGNPDPYYGVFFVPNVSCTAPAAEGSLVMPGALLASAGAKASGTLQLSVLPLPTARVIFRAPLTTGGTFPIVISYSLSTTQPLTLP